MLLKNFIEEECVTPISLSCGITYTCIKSRYVVSNDLLLLLLLLLQMRFHSVAVVLPIVQTKQMIYINETIQIHSTNNTKHSKYKYLYYRNAHTLQNPHIHTPTHKKTNTYTRPHFTKSTHTHTHTLQNKFVPQKRRAQIPCSQISHGIHKSCTVPAVLCFFLVKALQTPHPKSVTNG